MCLLYIYVTRQGPNQYPSCAVTWTRTSLVQCTPRVCGVCFCVQMYCGMNKVLHRDKLVLINKTTTQKEDIGDIDEILFESH
jgi:hypothetical protein